MISNFMVVNIIIYYNIYEILTVKVWQWTPHRVKLLLYFFENERVLCNPSQLLLE
jgi:hypothetical protein